ncbi:MAG: hypothetical protein H5T86_04385 [Armatimonadetes bacterium]|nr:hypothetical protein [Armatimonadota bacterium]
MKKKLVWAMVLVIGGLACAFSLAVGVKAWSAPPGGIGNVPPVPFKACDLVVWKVELTKLQWGGEFPSATLRVWVKNIGSAQASPSVTAVGLLHDSAVQPPLKSLWCCQIPALDPNMAASADITAFFGTDTKSTLIAVADAPVAGKPCGQCYEGPGAGELNNAFAAPFDVAKVKVLPHTWSNPAVK